MAKELRDGELGGIALIAGGFVLVAMSVAGYEVGAWIDLRAQSSPTGAIIGLLLGLIIGFWDIFRIASRVMRAQPPISASAMRAAKKNWDNTKKSHQDAEDREQDHDV